MNLLITLKALYPTLVQGDYSSEIIDGVEVIARWNPAFGPQPTQTEIDAAGPAAESAFIISMVRIERDRRLSATDYMAMPDYPNKPAGLAAYRQSLRDFPATVNVAAHSWPLDIAVLDWPKL